LAAAVGKLPPNFCKARPLEAISRGQNCCIELALPECAKAIKKKRAFSHRPALSGNAAGLLNKSRLEPASWVIVEESANAYF
jgi:hypothetical protein